MLAIELHPEAGRARRACEALARRGGARQGRARAHDPHRPPLLIRRDEVNWAVERFAAIRSSERELPPRRLEVLSRIDIGQARASANATQTVWSE